LRWRWIATIRSYGAESGQKLEFILDSAAPASPTDAELQSWLDAHPGDYQTEPTYSLRQVFFNPARHGDALGVDIAAARRALERGKAIEGDTTLLPHEMNAARATDVARVFGDEFVEGLATTAIGGWHGPMRRFRRALGGVDRAPGRRSSGAARRAGASRTRPVACAH
jgi:hypothetical protein